VDGERWKRPEASNRREAVEVSKHDGGGFPGAAEEEEGKNDQSLMPTLINDIYFGSFFY